MLFFGEEKKRDRETRSPPPSFFCCFCLSSFPPCCCCCGLGGCCCSLAEESTVSVIVAPVDDGPCIGVSRPLVPVPSALYPRPTRVPRRRADPGGYAATFKRKKQDTEKLGAGSREREQSRVVRRMSLVFSFFLSLSFSSTTPTATVLLRAKPSPTLAAAFQKEISREKQKQISKCRKCFFF